MPASASFAARRALSWRSRGRAQTQQTHEQRGRPATRRAAGRAAAATKLPNAPLPAFRLERFFARCE